MPDRPRQPAPNGGGETGTLVVEHRFAVVPEWLIDTPIGDSAFRLYVILLRYGNTSGQRMPGRATLARRLRKSTDTVDRALRELQQHGAVTVERRRDGQRNLTNRYQLRTTPPGSPAAPARPARRALGPRAAGRADAATRLSRACPYTGPRPAGSRRSAATPPPPAGTARALPTELTSRSISSAPAAGVGGGRTRAATPGRSRAATRARPGRTRAARVAAPVRPDPEPPTEKEPPPTPSTTSSCDNDRQRLLPACGLPPDGLEQLARDCQQARRDLAKPTTRWTTARLVDALTDAVRIKHWPAEHAVAALRAIAADPTTASPMRLGYPGPWWDHPAPTGAAAAVGSTGRDPAELAALEALLAEADGRRITVQRQAREQLHAEGRPLTRLAVARRAYALLEERASVPMRVE